MNKLVDETNWLDKIKRNEDNYYNVSSYYNNIVWHTSNGQYTVPENHNYEIRMGQWINTDNNAIVNLPQGSVPEQAVMNQSTYGALRAAQEQYNQEAQQLQQGWLQQSQAQMQQAQQNIMEQAANYGIGITRIEEQRVTAGQALQELNSIYGTIQPRRGYSAMRLQTVQDLLEESALSPEAARRLLEIDEMPTYNIDEEEGEEDND